MQLHGVLPRARAYIAVCRPCEKGEEPVRHLGLFLAMWLPKFQALAANGGFHALAVLRRLLRGRAARAFGGVPGHAIRSCLRQAGRVLLLRLPPLLPAGFPPPLSVFGS